MRIEPIRYYVEPGFPTHRVLEEHPELLTALPERWRVNPIVLATLAGSCLILAGLTGCRAKSTQAAPQQPNNRRLHQIRPVILGKPARIVTELGELESRKIIVNEAKKHGIFFSPTKKKVKVTIPLSAQDKKQAVSKSVDLVFELDGLDEKHRLAYEVVSRLDAESLASKYPWFTDLAGYGPDNAARKLDTELKKDQKEHYFVVATPECYTEKDAEKQLRKQVQDFIKWLKAEGVI